MKNFIKKLFVIILTLSLLTGCSVNINKVSTVTSIDDIYELIEEYSTETYVEVNDNNTTFSDDDMVDETYIQLSQLDSLGRTGTAKACLGPETLPEEGETRGSIGMIKPSGWHTQKYDKSLVENGYIYNRSHQIAWCLSGLNAEEKNLMTGTRSFNVDGMLPFETKTVKYIQSTGNHVIYESTPIFENDELVARALQLQAKSVEDDGLEFNVLIMNKQDGIDIDYETGETSLASTSTESDSASQSTSTSSDTIEKSTSENDTKNETSTDSGNSTTAITYILNTNSMKFHTEDCQYAKDIKAKNKKTSTSTRDEIINEGYSACKSCNP
jgi:DNA-entry nuclease